jgi:hypothetical protein
MGGTPYAGPPKPRPNPGPKPGPQARATVATNATTKIRPKMGIVVFFMEITSFLWSFSAFSVSFLTSEEKAEIDFLRKYFTNDELDR